MNLNLQVKPSEENVYQRMPNHLTFKHRFRLLLGKTMQFYDYKIQF